MSGLFRKKLVDFIDSIATTSKMIHIVKTAALKFAKKSTTARGKKSKKRKTHKRKQTGGGLLKLFLKALSLLALVYILGVLRDNADAHTVQQIDNFVKANYSALLTVGGIVTINLIKHLKDRYEGRETLLTTPSNFVIKSYAFSDDYINNGKCTIKPFVDGRPLEENEYYILCDKHQMGYLENNSIDYFVDFSLVKITSIKDNQPGLLVTYEILHSYHEDDENNESKSNTFLYENGQYDGSRRGKVFSNPIFLHRFPKNKFFSYIDKVLTNVNKYTEEDGNLSDELDFTEEKWSTITEEELYYAIIRKFTIPPGDGIPEGKPVSEYFDPTETLR